MTAIADLPAAHQFRLALLAAMDSESFEAEHDPEERDELYPTPSTVEDALHIAGLLAGGDGLGCHGYEKEVELLQDTVKLLATALRAALDHTTVEVLHQREPDEGCDITVWVNGIKHDAEVDDVDPGRGYNVDDWDDYTEALRSRSLRPELSDAFRAAAVAARMEARTSSYIDKDDEETILVIDGVGHLAGDLHDEPYDDEDGDDNGMEVVQP